MSVHKIQEPKITRVIHSVTVQLVEVEGRKEPLVTCNNPDMVPHQTVVDLLQHAAYMIEVFIKEQN